jgi:hypothetical protein
MEAIARFTFSGIPSPQHHDYPSNSNKRLKGKSDLNLEGEQVNMQDSLLRAVDH